MQDIGAILCARNGVAGKLYECLSKNPIVKCTCNANDDKTNSPLAM